MVMETMRKPRNITYNGTSPAYAGNTDLSYVKVSDVKQKIPAGHQHATQHPGADNPHHVCFHIQVPSVLC